MSRPPRFVLHHPIEEGMAILDGAELHHLRDVLRLREGTAIALISSDNAEYFGHVAKLEDHRAIIIIEKTVRGGVTTPLILATAVIKGPRMDFLIEKAAELGVTELWPTLCARNVVQAPGAERIGRWRRLASAAAKQSLARGSLELHEAVAFADLIESLAKDTLAGGETELTALKMICTMGAEPIASVMRRIKPHSVLIACGPEGDFTEAEMALAKGAGFVAVGLGKQRLRSETAAIAAVSVAAALLDEFGEGD